MGAGLTHTENLMIKNLRKMRETNGLELEQEEVEPTIGRKFKIKFEIPNEYTENILITDSDFILSDSSYEFDQRLFSKKNIKMGSSCSDRDQDWEAWRHSLPQFHKSPANTYVFGDESR